MTRVEGAKQQRDALADSDGHRPSVSLHDFLTAHALVREYVKPTLLAKVPELGDHHEVTVLAKHENHAPGRSFKVRGAIYSVSLLTQEQRAAGVVTSSTGNHAIGLACAAGLLGTTAIVVVPDNAPALKVDHATRLGADVRRMGSDLAQAEVAARAIASQEGRHFVEDGDDWGLMVGAGTIALEVLLQHPETDVILVPVGGGNLIAGIASCAKALRPEVTVVGVQSSAAPAVYESWRSRCLTHAPCGTFAEGLATDHPGRLAFEMISAHVDEILLVTDDELLAAMATSLDVLGEVVEGAGAATIAALARYGERWRGLTVAAVLTGGNCDSRDLARLYGSETHSSEPAR